MNTREPIPNAQPAFATLFVIVFGGAFLTAAGLLFELIGLVPFVLTAAMFVALLLVYAAIVDLWRQL